MKSITDVMIGAMHAGARIATAVIIAEVVRDVAIRVTDTYRETHQPAARRSGSAAK
jgi:hypothetical protein